MLISSMGNNSSFFIALSLFLLINNINSSIDEDAIISFKNTITSDPHGLIANNWSTNTPFCSWIGVSCNTKHHRVTALNLSGYGLIGPITPHLGNLTFITSLDLSFNNFTGPIPNELSNLRRLQVLNVAVNSLTGSIPSWLGTLSQLQRINLNNNTFSGNIPPSIFNSSTLLTLDIAFNFLDGDVPTMYTNFSSLETINLEYNRFTSHSVIYTLFNMSSLTAVNLRGNGLLGTLPHDMCDNIPRLRILYLSANQLYGEIPLNIYKCRDLEDLRLPNNRFSGNIPNEIGSLVNLTILSLGDNGFTGGIPKQLGNLTMLKQLYLSRNELTGELPHEIGNVDLVNMGVSYNSLSGPVPFSMFNISTLRIMDISNNRFTGILPSPITWRLLNLENLYLDNNRLTGPIPSYITNATKLTLLDIGKNSFSGPIPDFGNLRLLQALILAGNNFTGGASSSQELVFYSSLTNCQRLIYLEVSGNPLNGILPAAIGNLSTSLQSFRAASCHLKGSIPSEIGNLTGLLSIVLEINELTGSIPTTLGNLNNLQGLYLDQNQLQGNIPFELCHMRNLVDLYLYSNILTGPIPECFGEVTTLRRVYLGSNNLSSNIPSTFWNLRDVVAVGLSSNYLSGHLSPDIANFKAILELNLSYNQFSGDIPSSIDECQSLSYLSLANNAFGGSIPRSLGNIRSLEILNLSFNSFVGSIPRSLEGLRFLQYFNVSYNRLEGEIPTEGPFVNFTAQSFVHNSALCGLARFQVPPCVETRTRSRRKLVVSLMKYILPPIFAAIIMVIIILILIRRRKQDIIPPASDSSIGNAWRRISYHELMQGTDAFSENNLLGRGGFGSVFKGSLSDGLNVAVKVFKLQSEGASKSFDTESEILSSVRHRNLVRIIGCCTNADFKALVLAYMPNGSLEKWLYSNEYRLDLLQRLDIAIDVAVALEYLHHGNMFPIVHCDLKPSNVLLDEDMTAHVADFGISKLFGEGETVAQTKTMATIGYTAPEYGSEGKVSTKGDVYSYGIMLMEMYTGKKPTDDMFSDEMSLKDWVNGALLEDKASDIVEPGLVTRVNENLSANEKECICSIFRVAMQCLAVSPLERINMTNCGCPSKDQIYTFGKKWKASNIGNGHTHVEQPLVEHQNVLLACIGLLIFF